MSFIPTGFGEVFFRYLVANDSEEMVTSLGFESLGGTTLADFNNALDALVIDWETNINAGSLFAGGHNQWTYRGWRAEVKTSTGTFQLENTKSVVGTIAAETHMVNAALLVQKKSALGGRAHRGRFFVPPFGITNSSTNEAGVILAADLAVIQTKWTNLMSAMAADTAYSPMILHQAASPVPTEITSLSVSPKMATQRRRLRP